MAWSDTQEGSDVNYRWERFRLLFTDWLPQHKQSLINLSNRPFRR